MAGDLVWTHHVAERLLKRGISKNEAFDTIRHPDRHVRQSNGKWKFFKTYSHKIVTIVASKKNDQWIIITGWSKSSKNQNHPHNSSSEHFLSRALRRFLFKN